MSDDLISRKALIEEIQSFRCSITGLRAGKGVLAHAADEYMKSVSRIIDEQPAAFDKEKVIEKIRNVPHGYYNAEIENEIAEIVEKGGIE